MIENLSQQHCALFAAIICEKMYPNYMLFSETENWGDVDIYRQGVELLYKAAEEISIPVIEAQQTIIEFEQVFPDLDEFNSLAASFGFDASCALDAALNFLVSGDRRYIENCVQFAFDTLDMYVQEVEVLDPNQPDLEIIIDNNSYVVQERKRQQELFVLLSSTDTPTLEFITQLRQQQAAEPPIMDIEQLPE